MNIYDSKPEAARAGSLNDMGQVLVFRLFKLWVMLSNVGIVGIILLSGSHDLYGPSVTYGSVTEFSFSFKVSDPLYIFIVQRFLVISPHLRLTLQF